MEPSNSIEKIVTSQTRSIITPLIYALGIIGIIFIFQICFGKDELLTIKLFWTLIGILSVIGLAYVYFGLKSPDRLQSEEHVQEMTAMSLGSKQLKYIQSDVETTAVGSGIKNAIGVNDPMNSDKE